jgi:mRNA interferase MazF
LRRSSGLNRESVVNVSQLMTVDKRLLASRAGHVPPQTLRDIEGGIRLVLAL